MAGNKTQYWMSKKLMSVEDASSGSWLEISFDVGVYIDAKSNQSSVSRIGIFVKDSKSSITSNAKIELDYALLDKTVNELDHSFGDCNIEEYFKDGITVNIQKFYYSNSKELSFKVTKISDTEYNFLIMIVDRSTSLAPIGVRISVDEFYTLLKLLSHTLQNYVVIDSSLIVSMTHDKTLELIEELKTEIENIKSNVNDIPNRDTSIKKEISDFNIESTSVEIAPSFLGTFLNNDLMNLIIQCRIVPVDENANLYLDIIQSSKIPLSEKNILRKSFKYNEIYDTVCLYIKRTMNDLMAGNIKQAPSNIPKIRFDVDIEFDTTPRLFNVVKEMLCSLLILTAINHGLSKMSKKSGENADITKAYSTYQFSHFCVKASLMPFILSLKYDGSLHDEIMSTFEHIIKNKVMNNFQENIKKMTMGDDVIVTHKLLSEYIIKFESYMEEMRKNNFDLNNIDIVINKYNQLFSEQDNDKTNGLLTDIAHLFTNKYDSDKLNLEKYNLENIEEEKIEIVEEEPEQEIQPKEIENKIEIDESLILLKESIPWEILNDDLKIRFVKAETYEDARDILIDFSVPTLIYKFFRILDTDIRYSKIKMIKNSFQLKKLVSLWVESENSLTYMVEHINDIPILESEDNEDLEAHDFVVNKFLNGEI